MGGDDFYIGIYWALVFLPIQVITVIAYLIGKFTGSNMAGDISYFCNFAYVILSLTFMCRDAYMILRDAHKKNKEQSNPVPDEKR